LTLFQVGEFAFVLARVGVAAGALKEDLYALVLNTTVATMALTPVISNSTPWIYERIRRRQAEDRLEVMNVSENGLRNHVVIAGGGRVGRSIADALTGLRLPCVVIELDDRRVRKAREAGLAVIFGDASHAVVLEAAELTHASSLLVTVPTYPDVRAIVQTARRIRPDLSIIARADGPDAVRELYALGLQDVTSPEFEAAIEMTREALVRLVWPADEIQRVTTAMRRERYAGADAPSERR
jgi:CPA2 family monovalent cation:H+ antiporter-2